MGIFCAIFFHQNVPYIFLQFPWLAPCLLTVLVPVSDEDVSSSQSECKGITSNKNDQRKNLFSQILSQFLFLLTFVRIPSLLNRKIKGDIKACKSMKMSKWKKIYCTCLNIYWVIEIQAPLTFLHILPWVGNDKIHAKHLFSALFLWPEKSIF